MARVGLVSENETLTEDKIIKWLDKQDNIQAPGDNSRKFARQYELKPRRPDFALEYVKDSNTLIIIEAKHKDQKAGEQQAKEYLELAEKEGLFSEIVVIAASIDIKKKLILAAFSRKDGNLVQLENGKSPSIAYYVKQIRKEKEGVSKKKAKVKTWRETLDKELANLHEYVRNYCKSPFNEKINLLNGIFIALRSEHFVQNMNRYKDKDFSKVIYKAIDSVMLANSYDDVQMRAVTTAFKFLDADGYPSSDPSAAPSAPLSNKDIKETTVSFCKFASNYIYKFIIEPLKKDPEFGSSALDVSSVVYNEFIKYAKGDGKDLGIVLTPEHICDLMTDLIDLQPADTVLDICTGSGAFLVSAMKKKMNHSKTADEEIESEHNLVGVEFQPSMYSLAVANMLFNDADLTNLHMGSCFDNTITQKIKEAKPSKAILNPPYSMCKNQTMSDLHEWNFVLHALDNIEKGGLCTCIVPTSCGIKEDELNIQYKKELLEKHTLKAIIKCNSNLFGTAASTATSIYVFKAHEPNSTPTALINGEDEFKMSRGQRKDNGTWGGIKARILSEYSGEKTNYKMLKYTDCWDVVEADSIELSKSDFINYIKNL